MWKQKRKLETETPEAAIFYRKRSKSGKNRINESRSKNNEKTRPIRPTMRPHDDEMIV